MDHAARERQHYREGQEAAEARLKPELEAKDREIGALNRENEAISRENEAINRELEELRRKLREAGLGD
jgi:regulator of replication initiation timing